MNDLIFSSATELARRIREREVSSAEVVEAHLRRIAQVNPALNAVVTLAEDAYEQARRADAALHAGELRGPLHGVPMTIKDSFDTAGVVSTWGTVGRRDFVPDADATAVARMKAAGAILLGKTNTSEFTMSFYTNNRLFGPTRNPYNTERMSGGSSGGAAAIVAAGGSPIDLGTDTGGSVRLPAHYCGIAGIRPTSGRVPRTGHAIPFGGLADLLTQVGPLARRVEDLALALSVVSGPDGIDPYITPMPLDDYRSVDLTGLRVAYFTDNGVAAPTPETAVCVERVAGALAGAGCRVEESRPPGMEQSFDLLRGFLGITGRAGLKMALERAGTSRDETNLSFVHGAKALGSEELELFLERADRFRSEALTWFQPYDLLIAPVNAGPALPVGEIEDRIADFTYTMTHNLTGWPSAVVRVGTSPEGLPIGVQFTARPWREDVALAAAAYAEKVFGGWQRPTL
ncbi:MAG: amidase [Caldilineaceae bacterium]|nr:amidase [Caldilineaceae bacterium]